MAAPPASASRHPVLPLLGKAYPPYFALSALPVDHANVLDAWRQVYRTDAPADLRNSYQK